MSQRLEEVCEIENLTDAMVDFVFSVTIHDLSQEVIEKTRMFIADYYAASIAGYRINTKFNAVVKSIIREEGGAEQASVLFEDRKYPAGNAAFLNAVFAHGADMDDGNRNAAGHIGAHVLSAVFAVSEGLDVYWRDVFIAINAGFDFFNRIAGAAQPGLYNKGFHSTGIAGAMASTVACSKVMGLNREEIYNCVSLAALQSSGLIIVDESGQGCKPLNPANAARIGVLSAQMAERGMEGPRHPLESGKGWFNAFTDQIDTAVLFDGLGHKFTICESYLKFYPTCRHTHSCIEAGLEIRKKIGNEYIFQIENIDRINIYIYPSAIKSAGNIRFPKTPEEAKFSIHYAVATALKKGRFLLEDLSVKKVDATTRYLSDKIELIEDPMMENRKRGIRGARMQVILNNGKVYEETVLIPKGEGTESLTWDAIMEKMMNCSCGKISEKVAMRIVNICKDIDVDSKYKTILESFCDDITVK